VGHGRGIFISGETDQAARRRLPGLTVKEGLMRHPFDAANGVNTSGLVAGRHLASGHRSDRHATAYYGVAPSVFLALMRRWQRSKPGASVEETIFIDVGAGMGRAMLLAAEMPFRAVVGLELNPALARRARRNLSVWRKMDRARAPMRLVCGDATEFGFRSAPTVVFMFNPFGAPVMRRLLRAMSRNFAHHAGQLDVLYVNNEQEAVFEMQRGFVRLFHGQVKRSRADAKADHQILTHQPDGEYASANFEDCSIWRWMGR
jgi:SAM-dependent methyltransferase